MLELTCDTTLDLAASGARHGAGVFETIRVREGVPLRLEDHVTRLSRGAAFLGLEAPPSAEQIRSFLETQTSCPQLASGALRLLAVDRKLMVFLAPCQSHRPDEIRVGLSYRITRWSASPLNRFKTFSYLENLLLAREAEERGLFEAIALNESELLTDGGRTNLFLVKDGELLTPFCTDGALPGIARSLLLNAGLAKEASLGIDDLGKAEAICLTNALQGVVPVHALDDGTPLNGDHPLIQAAQACLESIRA